MFKRQQNKEARTANRRLAQWRVKWLIEHSSSHQLLWCIDSFVLRNPPLRQAPKRYLQYHKKYRIKRENMKIATWNIERLKTKKNLIPVVENIRKIDADILILTEFNNIVELPFYESKIETQKLPREPYDYKETERRVAIFSKFPIIKTFKTYDEMTSCCAEIQTNFGNLIVYGTIVGILGYSDKNFKTDLEKQTKDIKSLSKLGHFCYSGDLNTSFSDNYYFTHFAREKFIKCFQENDLINTTENLSKNIDHIVVSENFLSNFKFQISEWNINKEFSDHKGICIELKK